MFFIGFNFGEIHRIQNTLLTLHNVTEYVINGINDVINLFCNLQWNTSEQHQPHTMQVKLG